MAEKNASFERDVKDNILNENIKQKQMPLQISRTESSGRSFRYEMHFLQTYKFLSLSQLWILSVRVQGHLRNIHPQATRFDKEKNFSY